MKRLLFVSIFLISAPLLISAQGQGSGAATGEAKVYTSRRTVGIIDDKAPKIFDDVTPQTALKDFNCISGSKEKNYIIEATACTIAVIDYDNDGQPDIYLLNGSTINAELGKEAAPRAALFHNLGNWKFEDVTEKAGVANNRWGMGVAVADYDNDGYPDMFVSNYGVSRLYHNNGNGTFTDVAPKLGVDVHGWSTGATFGDYDRDGRLDLFVPQYIDFDLKNMPPSPLDVARGSVVARNFCQFRGEAVMCGPRGLKGAKDKLFHQKADGTFEEVSDKAGVRDNGLYYGFSSVFVDVDDDGWLDLVVVNDSTPKQLYINKKDGTFEEVGYQSGLALNENGREQAGMGLAVGDYDNDGRVDFHITNFSDDSNTLYRNDGDENFTDVSFQVGIGEPTIPFLGWGTAFIDYDNDGWKDLIVGNGHLYPLVDNFQWGTSFAQQLLLFRNVRNASGQTKFDRVPAAPASGLAEAICARGLALADFDGDGKLDAVINNMDMPPTLLKNVGPDKNNWLSLKLVGDTAIKSPKDAIGATVYLTTGKIRQRMDLFSGASYASQSQQILHFGLGNATKVDRLEVHWPNGQIETFPVGAVNNLLTLKQGTGAKP
ncbi:MAG TPA: CRTAC1 family protein [Pyrinomonadaceae bacterium]|nr:CRTAC1 family protein [Pyrinomonadaceae bacterium]